MIMYKLMQNMFVIVELPILTWVRRERKENGKKSTMPKYMIPVQV
jgi:hypothetical protein